ncbi:MAG: hypothetical protein PHC61_15190, partial [Chitinivibrionales bacterium]|nr:hypothetical protein [Chitinivibrionales bacterium]
MKSSLIPELIKRSKNIPLPGNYFSGTKPPSLELPRSILIFSRNRGEELGTGSFHHFRYVLIFNLKTAGMVMADNGLFHLRPGNALLIFPYQFHRFLELQTESLTWLFLTFELSAPDTVIQLKNAHLPVNKRIWSWIDEIIIMNRDKTTVNNDTIIYLTALILNELKEIARKTPNSA